MIIDFRLKVFQVVAQELSFSSAARQLFISQPAVTKHINELEKQVQYPLFNRNGRQVSLTKEGELILNYAQQILDLYNAMEDEVNELQERVSGQIKIAASTTIAQYILPQVLAKFKKHFPLVSFSLKSANTKDVEQMVLERRVDVGVVEGAAQNPLLHYEPFMEDEIVLTTSAKNKKSNNDSVDISAIKNYPLVLREQGSGTLEVILAALKEKGISLNDLKREIELGSSESVKSYLKDADAYAFLSVHTIADELKNGELKIIACAELTIKRVFHFISLHGQHAKSIARFKRFCRLSYS